MLKIGATAGGRDFKKSTGLATLAATTVKRRERQPYCAKLEPKQWKLGYQDPVGILPFRSLAPGLPAPSGDRRAISSRLLGLELMPKGEPGTC